MTSSTTNVNGEVTFVNPPADATVTAGISGPSPWNPAGTYYSLNVVYNVNVEAFTIGLSAGFTATPASTANVTVTDSLTSAGWLIQPGWQNGSQGVIADIAV